MKDFFDLWFLATRFEFEGSVLVRAVRSPFERRATELPATTPLALTKAFSEDGAKMAQWKAFLSSGTLLPTSTSLHDIVGIIAPFVVPPLDAARERRTFGALWKASGPWSPPPIR